MPPPPINWRTKPKPNQQCQDGSQSSSFGTLQQPGAATNAVVPVYVNPTRLQDIKAALLYLGLPPLLRPDSEDQVEYHRAANSPGRQISSEHSDLATSSLQLSTSDHASRLSTSDHTSRLSTSGHTSRLSMSGHTLQLSTSDHTSRLFTPGHTSQLSTSDLTASFSRLSTSTSSVQIPPALFPVRPTQAIHSNPSPRKSLKKYYVVTVGKCTGLFWDEW
jgi:hypothetical protein